MTGHGLGSGEAAFLALSPRGAPAPGQPHHREGTDKDRSAGEDDHRDARPAPRRSIWGGRYAVDRRHDVSRHLVDGDQIASVAAERVRGDFDAPLRPWCRVGEGVHLSCTVDGEEDTVAAPVCRDEEQTAEMTDGVEGNAGKSVDCGKA